MDQFKKAPILNSLSHAISNKLGSISIRGAVCQKINVNDYNELRNIWQQIMPKA